jgi:hypothetical protein
VRHLTADRDHDAGRLVTQHEREGGRQRAVDHRQIGMADPGRAHLHADTLRPETGQIDLLHRERFPDATRNQCPDRHRVSSSFPGVGNLTLEV